MSNTTYAIDDGNGNQITTGLSEHDARRVAQRIATERGESVYLYETPVRLDADGDPIDESEEVAPYDEDGFVSVEEMPDHLRGSHRAAGNWGCYPHNGATRRQVTREEAEAIVEDDPDGYASIVE